MASASATGISIIEEQIDVPLPQKNFLRMIRLYNVEGPGKPVFMLHGLRQNAGFFLDKTRKNGLALYMAKLGYDVYLGQLRGRGFSSSSDKNKKNMDLDLIHAIEEDLHFMLNLIEQHSGGKQQIWIGNEFGSTILISFLAKQPYRLDMIESMVHFNPLINTHASTWTQRFYLNFIKKNIHSTSARFFGYVPAFGSTMEKESWSLYKDALHCMDGNFSAVAGLDLLEKIKELNWPPSLYLSSTKKLKRDCVNDTRLFMFKLAPHNAQMIKLGTQAGNLDNYTQSDICLNPKAEMDFFPFIQNWLEQISQYGEQQYLLTHKETEQSEETEHSGEI